MPEASLKFDEFMAQREAPPPPGTFEAFMQEGAADERARAARERITGGVARRLSMAEGEQLSREIPPGPGQSSVLHPAESYESVPTGESHPAPPLGTFAAIKEGLARGPYESGLVGGFLRTAVAPIVGGAAVPEWERMEMGRGANLGESMFTPGNLAQQASGLVAGAPAYILGAAEGAAVGAAAGTAVAPGPGTAIGGVVGGIAGMGAGGGVESALATRAEFNAPASELRRRRLRAGGVGAAVGAAFGAGGKIVGRLLPKSLPKAAAGGIVRPVAELGGEAVAGGGAATLGGHYIEGQPWDEAIAAGVHTAALPIVLHGLSGVKRLALGTPQGRAILESQGPKGENFGPRLPQGDPLLAALPPGADPATQVAHARVNAQLDTVVAQAIKSDPTIEGMLHHTRVLLTRPGELVNDRRRSDWARAGALPDPSNPKRSIGWVIQVDPLTVPLMDAKKLARVLGEELHHIKTFDDAVTGRTGAWGRLRATGISGKGGPFAWGEDRRARLEGEGYAEGAEPLPPLPTPGQAAAAPPQPGQAAAVPGQATVAAPKPPRGAATFRRNLAADQRLAWDQLAPDAQAQFMKKFGKQVTGQNFNALLGVFQQGQPQTAPGAPQPAPAAAPVAPPKPPKKAQAAQPQAGTPAGSLAAQDAALAALPPEHLAKAREWVDTVRANLKLKANEPLPQGAFDQIVLRAAPAAPEPPAPPQAPPVQPAPPEAPAKPAEAAPATPTTEALPPAGEAKPIEGPEAFAKRVGAAAGGSYVADPESARSRLKAASTEPAAPPLTERQKQRIKDDVYEQLTRKATLEDIKAAYKYEPESLAVATEEANRLGMKAENAPAGSTTRVSRREIADTGEEIKEAGYPTPAETAALVARRDAGGADGVRAQQELAARHIKLVKGVLKEFPNVDEHAGFEVGGSALMKAAEKYKAGMESKKTGMPVKFTTYAAQVIRNALRKLATKGEEGAGREVFIEESAAARRLTGMEPLAGKGGQAHAAEDRPRGVKTPGQRLRAMGGQAPVTGLADAATQGQPGTPTQASQQAQGTGARARLGELGRSLWAQARRTTNQIYPEINKASPETGGAMSAAVGAHEGFGWKNRYLKSQIDPSLTPRLGDRLTNRAKYAADKKFSRDFWATTPILQLEGQVAKNRRIAVTGDFSPKKRQTLIDTADRLEAVADKMRVREFGSEAAYRLFRNSPRTEAALGKLGKLVSATREEAYRINTGREPGDVVPPSERDPYRVALVPADYAGDASAPAGAAAGDRFYKTRSGATRPVTGAEYYSTDGDAILQATFGKSIPPAMTTEAIRAGMRAGLLEKGHFSEPGWVGPFTVNLPRKSRSGKFYTANRLRPTDLFARADIAEEFGRFHAATDPFARAQAPSFWGKVWEKISPSRLLTWLQIQGPADVATHTPSIFAATIRAVGEDATLRSIVTSTVPGAKALTGIAGIGKAWTDLFIRGDADALRRAAWAESQGLLRTPRETKGLGRFAPNRLGGAIIHQTDAAAHVHLDRLFDAGVKAGVREDTPQNRRNYHARLGVYAAPYNGKGVNWLRRNVGPFTIAGITWPVELIKSVVGFYGGQAKGTGMNIANRAAGLWALGAGAILTPLAINLLRWDDPLPPGVKLGEIKTGEDADGRVRAFDWANLNGFRRDPFDTGRAAMNRRAGQTLGQVTDDMIDSLFTNLVRPALGPPASAAQILLTGTIGFPHPKPVVEPGTGIPGRLLATLRHVNPTGLAFSETPPAGKTALGQALAPLARGIGIASRDKPDSAAARTAREIAIYKGPAMMPSKERSTRRAYQESIRQAIRGGMTPEQAIRAVDPPEGIDANRALRAWGDARFDRALVYFRGLSVPEARHVFALATPQEQEAWRNEYIAKEARAIVDDIGSRRRLGLGSRRGPGITDADRALEARLSHLGTDYRNARDRNPDVLPQIIGRMVPLLPVEARTLLSQP